MTYEETARASDSLGSQLELANTPGNIIAATDVASGIAASSTGSIFVVSSAMAGHSAGSDYFSAIGESSASFTDSISINALGLSGTAGYASFRILFYSVTDGTSQVAVGNAQFRASFDNWSVQASFGSASTVTGSAGPLEAIDIPFTFGVPIPVTLSASSNAGATTTSGGFEWASAFMGVAWGGLLKVKDQDHTELPFQAAINAQLSPAISTPVAIISSDSLLDYTQSLVAPTPAPEPSTLVVGSLALAGIILRRHEKMRSLRWVQG